MSVRAGHAGRHPSFALSSVPSVRPLETSNAINKPQQFQRQPDESLCHHVLRVAGLDVHAAVGGQFVLRCIPALFSQSISHALLQHTSGNPTVAAQELIDGFVEWAQDDTVIRKCLTSLVVEIPKAPNENADLAKDRGSLGGFDSLSPPPTLLHLLLIVDQLQTRLVKWMLESVIPLAGDDEDSPPHGPSVISTPTLALRHLRHLLTSSRLADPVSVSMSLVGAIEIAQGEIRRELVGCVGDVGAATGGEVAVSALSDLLDTPELRPAALDALANMGLSESVQSDLRSRLFETMRDPDLATLPLTLRFVLQSGPSGNAGRAGVMEEMAQSLRSNLDVDVIADLVDAAEERDAAAAKGKGKAKTVGGTRLSEEALVLDQLRSSLRGNMDFRDAVVTVIGKSSDHNALDILLLFLARPTLRKKIDALFVRKCTLGLFTSSLFARAVGRHAVALRPYAEQVVGVMEVLLRGGCGSAAATIVSETWKKWEDYERQEIVHSLVVHAGSGTPTDVEVALSILLSLAKKDREGAARFAVFVKNLLDQLDSMSLKQVGMLFEALAVLTLPKEDDHGSSAVGSEVMIALTKQLTHPLDRYRRIGVMAACALVKHWGSTEMAGEIEDLGKSPLRDAVEVLEMVKRCAQRSMSALTLACDELSDMVSSKCLFIDISQWIQENFVSLIEEFAWKQADLDHMSTLLDSDDCFVDASVWMNMVTADDGIEEVGFPFYPLAIRPESATCGQEYTAYGLSVGSVVAPLGRLYFACGAAKNEMSEGHLLLGSVMWEEREVTQLKLNYGVEMLEAACTSVFNTINWFREVINAFCVCTEDKFALQVVSRLKDLVRLESLLDDLARATLTWCPFELQEAQTAVVSFTVGVKTSDKNVKRERRESSVTSDVGLAGPSRASRNAEEQSDEDSDLERPSTPAIILQPKKAVTKVDGGRATVRRSATGTKKNKRVNALREEEEEKTKVKKEKAAGQQIKGVKQLAGLLRDLSLDVFALLRFHGPGSENNEGKPSLAYPECRFLLEDLSRKLSSKLCVPSSNSFGRRATDPADKWLNGSQLRKMTDAEVVARIVPVVPTLLSLLERIVNELPLLRDAAERKEVDAKDAEELPTAELKTANDCLGLLLQILIDLLNWSGFKSAEHHSLMKRLLKAFTDRLAWPKLDESGSSSGEGNAALQQNSEQSQRPLTAQRHIASQRTIQIERRATTSADLVHATFKYLINCDAALLGPDTAVRFLRTLDAVLELFPEDLKALDREGVNDKMLTDMHEKLRNMARRFLALEWPKTTKIKASPHLLWFEII
ncbi:Fanconi anemia group D2 protein [Gonapodya sp. JEL0774]|nr:Fanconi anemia group D2 protein [Gonapodya sp. JEL0774]